MNFEIAYKDSLKDLLFTGIKTSNRTGIDTLVKHHQFFELPGKFLPVLKGKKVFPKLSLAETIWMLLGRTDTKWLREHGVKYWDNWQDENGTIGKSYGYQFRNFNGVDQLQDAVNQLLTNPDSRRIIINLFNAGDLSEMTLPPCVHSYQFSTFSVDDAISVSLHVLARSNDAFLGVPYDFMNAYFILNIIVDYLNKCQNSVKYIADKIYYTANNYHLYTNHCAQAIQYVRNVEERPYITEQEIPVKVVSCAANGCSLDDYLNDLAEHIQDLKIPMFKGYEAIKADIAV